MALKIIHLDSQDSNSLQNGFQQQIKAKNKDSINQKCDNPLKRKYQTSTKNAQDNQYEEQKQNQEQDKEISNFKRSQNSNLPLKFQNSVNYLALSVKDCFEKNTFEAQNMKQLINKKNKINPILLKWLKMSNQNRGYQINYNSITSKVQSKRNHGNSQLIQNENEINKQKQNLTRNSFIFYKANNQSFSQVQRQKINNFIQKSSYMKTQRQGQLAFFYYQLNTFQGNIQQIQSEKQSYQRENSKVDLNLNSLYAVVKDLKELDEKMFRIQFKQNEKSRLLGGGGCYSHTSQVQPQSIKHKKLDKQNLNQIQGLQKDNYFKQDDGQQKQGNNNQEIEKKNNKRQNFNTHYEAYFTNEKVDEDEIETHVRLIVEEVIYRYREKIVLQEIRYKVIDLINLIINYLLVVIQKNDTQSLQQDIDEIDKKLKTLQKYCLENRKRYPCMDLYYYMEILISLNQQRQGLDRANQSAISKIAEKIIQVAKFGAGFVSIAGAIQNLTQINFDELKKFVQEVKEIYAQVAQSSQQVVPIAQNAIVSYNKGNLFHQICSLWMRKIEALGENILDAQKEIIFYLEERDKMQNKEIILFVYMQLNYLLAKQQKVDDLVGLSKELIKLKKQNLIIDFANELQLKQYQSGVIDYIKNLANLIAFNEQFRYLKASLLQKMAIIIYNFDNKKQEYQSIMIDLCLNYIQEKEVSVKIVYKGNQKMKEFIDNIDKYYQEILNESQQLNKQMTKFVEDKEQIEQISNNIQTEQDIPKLLAINFVQMWEVGVKQRLDQHKIAHKDDALLEAINLYVKQSISYQDGFNIIAKQNSSDQIDNQIKSNDALKYIIENFLIYNYVSSSKDNQPTNGSDQKNLNRCKILSILAEGGSGKSMLLKKLEVELLKSDSEYVKDERAQYIPLIIKCNSLDLENPSIEKYLKSQNLRESEIEILKKSERNKILMLDGYDEYTGNYFKVFKELKIYEWVNTLVIVTSRLEKISVSDAKNYFCFYDENGKKGDNVSFAVVKLERISHSDIQEYLAKFKAQMQEKQNKLNEEDYNTAQEIIFKNKNLIELLKLPINLYLTTRMMSDLNLKDEKVKETLKKASDQIEIQELFFQEQFEKQAQKFVAEIKNQNQQEEVIQKIKSTYFEYFQNIAMIMFCQKGKKQNFLSSRKAEINFQLREEVKKCLKQNKIKEQVLIQNLTNFIDQRVITRIKLSTEKENEDKQNEIDEQEYQMIDEDFNSEFEFRHKSIFEYFAARAMKFDFDVYQENIHKLPLKQLEKFNINQKLIMNAGYNKSEQQILLKLFKLIDIDLNNVDYTDNYTQNEIEKNNRYIQYVKRSQISRYDQISTIDIGSSNLLSALFLSKFSFQNLKLFQCSLSKLYNIGNKKSSLNFDQCNLNNALLKNIKMRSVESSYIEKSVFDAVQQIFSTQQIYNFTQIAFEQNKLISVNDLGFINSFSIQKGDKNQFILDQSKQITCSPLSFLKIFSKNYALVTAKATVFLINLGNLQVHSIKKFESKITSLDSCNNQIILQLKNQNTYFGNFESGFKEISIQGNNAKFSKNADLIMTINQNDILLFNKKDQNFTQLKNINCHNLKMISAVFSPDNKFLASSSEDKTCKIWNLEKGNELVYTLQGHEESIDQIKFSNDGKYFASISQDKTCKLWNVTKGYELMKTFEMNENIPNSISFSTDGKYLAISKSNQCEIINIEKELEVFDKINGHTQKIVQVTFSGNGQYLATGSKDQTCKIWDAKDGFQLIKTIQQYKNPNQITFSLNGKYFAMISSENICQIFDQTKEFELIHSIQNIQSSSPQIAFSPNSKLFAVSSDDKTCKIFNVEQGFTLINQIDKNNDKFTLITFSANNKYLAIGYDNQKQLFLYDTEKQFVQFKALNNSQDTIKLAAFSGDGKYLAICLNNEDILVYNLEQEFKFIKKIKCHEYHTYQITFSVDTKYFATCSMDQKCKLWRVDSGFEHINTINLQSDILSIAFSSQGNYLATACDESQCQVWQTEELFEFINKAQAHDQYITSIAFSSDCKYLATGSDENICKIWNVQNRFELFTTIKAQVDNRIYSVAFSLNGKYFAIGQINLCMVYDVGQGFQFIKELQGNASMMSLSFSPDGKYLASGSIDRSCKVWNIEQDFLLIKNKELWNGEDVICSAFSPDSKYLASGNIGAACYIWLANNDFESNSGAYHKNRVTSVNFSPDNKYLATGSYDMTCKIWDVQNNFSLVKTIEGHTQDITSVIFSSNSQYLITSSNDKKCKIWNQNQDFSLVATIKCPKSINKMDLSYDGKYLATCQSDNSCIIWNIQRIINSNSISEKEDSNGQSLQLEKFQRFYPEYMV